MHTRPLMHTLRHISDAYHTARQATYCLVQNGRSHLCKQWQNITSRRCVMSCDMPASRSRRARRSATRWSSVSRMASCMRQATLW